MEIIYKFDLTIEKNRIINEELFKKRGKVNRVIIFLLLFLLGIILLNGAYLIFIGAVKDYFLEILCLIYFVILLFAKKIRIFRYDKLFKSSNISKNSSLEYFLTDDKVIVKTQFSVSEFNWGAITKIYSLKDYYLLMPNKINFHIIPKNVLDKTQNEWLIEKFLSLKLIKNKKFET
jgi:hypothetical protein